MREKTPTFLIHGKHGCRHSWSLERSTYPNTLEPLLGPNIESILLELEEKFPPVNPHPKETIGAIMYKAGQRSVIEWLQHRLEDN